jgi:acyl dehydratase
MAKQLYFEDVEVGTDITPISKHPSTTTLVKWAGATEDYYPIHYDKDFALTNKLPGVIVHGRLKAAYLGNLMTNWIGDLGVLKKLTCNYRGMDLPCSVLTCKGKVTKKYTQDGENLVECDIWVENDKGERTTPGSAVVALPLRKKK